MDLDSFHKQFLALQARVLPMLAEWEASKKPEELSEELRAQIYAPLSSSAEPEPEPPAAAPIA